MAKKTKPFDDLPVITRDTITLSIITMHVKGHSYLDMVEFLNAEYNTNYSTDELVTYCNTIVRKHYEKEVDYKLSEITNKQSYISNYKYLYKIALDRAEETGNTKNAKDCLDSLVKLEGLITDKQEIKVSEGFKIEF